MFYTFAISGKPEIEITTSENLYLNYLLIIPVTSSLAMEERSVKLVSKIFAIEDFKPSQLSCCESLIDNIDCFVCQPTGSGRSVIFQTLPFLSFARDNATSSHHHQLAECCSYKSLIISPLISLMQDQENYLKSRGIRAGSLSLDKECIIEVSFLASSLDCMLRRMS